ncbi:MAG: hypothetical protein C0519_06745 [Hyphomicrobium sp.]|nr:hypothetical protein [Hyphomicrobium sp.]
MSIENRDRLINLIDYFKEHGKIVLAPAEVMPFAREALVVTAEDPEPTDWRKRTIELFMVSGFWGTNCAGHVFSDSVTEEVKYQERYHLIGLFPISKEFLVKRPGSDIEEALEPIRKTFDDLPRATEEQIELARSVANKTTCSPTARNAL